MYFLSAMMSSEKLRSQITHFSIVLRLMCAVISDDDVSVQLYYIDAI